MPTLQNDFASLSLQRPDAARRRVRLLLCLCLSLVLHSSALAAVILLKEQMDVGAISNPSQAISVEIVASTVLEALQVSKAEDQPAANEATARNTGKALPEEPTKSEPKQEVTAAQTELKEAAPQPADTTEHEKPKLASEEPAPVQVAPQPETKPDGSDETQQAESDVAKAHEAAEVARKEAQKREEKREAERKNAEREHAERRKDEEHKKQRTRQAQGGATAKSSSADSGSPSRASASAGSMLTYAARVRAQVASHQPSWTGARGVAWVSFGVTNSGELRFASISRSSGDAALDRLALSALRSSAPFPAPPAGATPNQLTFHITYTFK